MSEKPDELESFKVLFEQLGDSPMIPAVVLHVGERVLIAKGSEVLEVAKPATFELELGDQVMLLSSTGNIFKKANGFVTFPQVSVERMIDKKTVEVSQNNNKRIISAGKLRNLQPGQLVHTDPSGSFCLSLVPETERENEYGDTGSDVFWDDIAGQVEAKATLRESIEGPHLHPEIYAHYGKKAVKGVLLSGPPGCGKTMLGKAVATAVAKLHDNPAASGFIYVKGPEILNPYVGVAEANVRNLFRRAREHFAKLGVPAVIFIDEADAILGVRGGHHSHMEKTIVPMFLTEMDGMDASAAMVILATNRPDQLDPAVTREGRIDHKIQVARPTVRDTFALFQLYLARVPTADDVETMAAFAAQEMYRGDLHLYDLVTERGEIMKFLFQHLNSGSMVANIVNQASTLAMRRDLEAKTVTGINQDDVITAVGRVFETNRYTNHEDAIKEFAGAHQITNVRKCHVAAAEVN